MRYIASTCHDYDEDKTNGFIKNRNPKKNGTTSATSITRAIGTIETRCNTPVHISTAGSTSKIGTTGTTLVLLLPL